MNIQEKLSVVQTLAAKRVLAFLSSNDSTNSANGITLLNETYKTVLEHMKADQDSFSGVSFSLFKDTAQMLLRTLKQLPISYTESAFSFQAVRNILYTSVLTGDDDTISSLRYFMRELGGCISLRRKSGDVYNSDLWGEIFIFLSGKVGYHFSDSIHDDTARGKYIKYLHVLAFDYCYGLLMSGVTGIMKQYFYGSFIRYTTIDPRQRVQAKYSLFLAMAVQAFAFYIAEKADNIDPAVREAADTLIHDNDVKNHCYIFMNRLAGRDALADILSRDFAKEFENFLYSYEIPHNDNNPHSILSVKIAASFFMFFTGYIAMGNDNLDMLDKAFDIDSVKYYFSLEHGDETRKSFADFFKLAECRHNIESILSGEHIFDRISVMSNRLYDFISNWIKGREMIFADIVQECHAKEPKLDDYVRACAEQRLQKDFAVLSKIPLAPRKTITIKSEVLRVSILTHMEHDKSIIDSSIMCVSTNLMLRIIDELKKCADFRTTAFSSVDEYLAELKACNISLLIGDEFTINNINLTRNYEEFQKLKDVLKDYKHSYIPMLPINSSVLALQSDTFGIKYNYIIADINPPSDEEIDSGTREENGIYRYGSEDFKFTSLDELRNYVRKCRRIITVEVQAEIMISTANSITGLIIEQH